MYDYVVIGGGSAGCVLAARLSEDPQVRVALLEAGGVDSSVLIHCPAGLALMAKTKGINWRFQTVPQPGLNGRRGYQPRGKVLGGSSSINAMIYIRGQRQDYDTGPPPATPAGRWTTCCPGSCKAEGNLRGADDLHGADGPLNVHGPAQPQSAGRPLHPGRRAGRPAAECRLQRPHAGRRGHGTRPPTATVSAAAPPRPTWRPRWAAPTWR
jgi:choline dehydrogenase-like flavoprotein